MLVWWFKNPTLFTDFLDGRLIISSCACVCVSRAQPDRMPCKSTFQRGIDIAVVYHTRSVNVVLSFFFVGTCDYMPCNDIFPNPAHGYSWYAPYSRLSSKTDHLQLQKPQSAWFDFLARRLSMASCANEHLVGPIVANCEFSALCSHHLKNRIILVKNNQIWV